MRLANVIDVEEIAAHLRLYAFRREHKHLTVAGACYDRLAMIDIWP